MTTSDRPLHHMSDKQLEEIVRQARRQPARAGIGKAVMAIRIGVEADRELSIRARERLIAMAEKGGGDNE